VPTSLSGVLRGRDGDLCLVKPRPHSKKASPRRRGFVISGRPSPAWPRLILQGVGQPNIDGSLFGYFYAFPLPRQGDGIDKGRREQQPLRSGCLALSSLCSAAASF